MLEVTGLVQMYLASAGWWLRKTRILSRRDVTYPFMGMLTRL